MNAPGSPSSALQMMYFSSLFEAFANFHLRPVGKPAPPRPRMPESVTCAMIHSGVFSLSASARGLVAAARDVLVDALRVDDPHVTEGDARLPTVEADVVPVADALAGLLVLVEELLDRRAVLEVLFDHDAHVPGTKVPVEGVVAEHDHRTHGAEAVAADDRDFHAISEARRLDLLDEGVVDRQ